MLRVTVGKALVCPECAKNTHKVCLYIDTIVTNHMVVILFTLFTFDYPPSRLGDDGDDGEAKLQKTCLDGSELVSKYRR